MRHLRSSVSMSERRRNLFRDKCKHNLKANGHSNKDFLKCENKYSNYRGKSKLNNKRTCTLKLPFVSDSLVRNINQLIRKYKLDISFVSRGNKTLRNALKMKSISNHEACDLCEKLQNNYTCRCDVKRVLYQFTCKRCTWKYYMFIRKTARPFDIMYNEHKIVLKTEAVLVL